MFGGSKKPSSNHFDTLIAKGTEINGNIVASGGLHIDGKIVGRITAQPENKNAVVRLSEVGEVEGDIIAPHVIINGKVHGDVYSSEHIELAAKASITGNVYYNLIEMAMGAEVNGSLVHDKEALPAGVTPLTKATQEPPKASANKTNDQENPKGKSKASRTPELPPEASISANS